MFKKSLPIVVALVGMLASSALADFTVYATQADFEQANVNAGYMLAGIEDFEEAVGPPYDVVTVVNPLEFGAANPSAFPSGLAQEHVWLSSLAGGEPSANNMVAVFPNTFGSGSPPSVVVGATAYSDSTGIFFDAASNFTSIAVDVMDPSWVGNETVDITVYDTSDQVIAEIFGWDAPVASQQFFGIITTDPIGWIDVAGEMGTGGHYGGEVVDNIQMWTNVPEPAALSLLALGGLVTLRRRR